MTNKIIQLVPWRDLLLALTEQGEIYKAGINDAGVEDLPTFVLWSRGIPESRR